MDKPTTCQFLFYYLVKWKSNTSISITIGVAIISTALMLSPSIHGELHFLLGSAYYALASAMACRVFRAVFLGIITDHHDSTYIIPSIHHVAINNPHGDGSSTTSSHVMSGLAPAFALNMVVKADTTMESADEPIWAREPDARLDGPHNV